MRFKSYTLAFISSLILLLVPIGCGEDDIPEDQQLQEFFASNNIVPQRTASGLYYVIEEPGTFDKPTASSVVTVNYRGYLLNGDVFDSSYDRGEAAEFPLSGTILGWREGIPLFGKGGKGSIYMASNFGYGARGISSIPGFSPLAFDIELIDFE